MKINLFALYFCLLPCCAFAQAPASQYTKRPLPAVKVTTPPVIDGDISDAIWKTAPKAETFLDSQNGTPVQDQTTAYIVYDAKYIYLAFDCRESEPDKIYARETLQDYRITGTFDRASEDAVEVGFDFFQSHRIEDRTVFTLNAIGTRSARLAGGRGGKVEWKGDWIGAVKRTPTGWTAEMRIPWAIVNYPAGKKPVTMCINFVRTQSRTRLTSRWCDLGPQLFLDHDGLWQGVEVPKGSFHPKLSVLPYLLPGVSEGHPGLRTGVDSRFTITPELTVVNSINPDFGTVQGAIESIQFSRSERFVPERRPFFLEGADYFRGLSIDAIGLKFFSNHIPTFDLGTKVYGKLSPTDSIGLLHTVDFNNRNDLVTRFRHQLSPNANTSILLIQKSAIDDTNTVAGVDQDARWGKLVAQSEWNVSAGHNAGGDAKQINFGYLDKLFSWYAGYADVSPIFRDANGLIPYPDSRGVIGLVQWYSEWRKGYWRNLTAYATPSYFLHYDGRPYRRGVQAGINMETRSDWGVGMNLNYDKFEDQRDSTLDFTLTKGVSNRFRRVGLEITTGTQADRPYFFVGPTFSLRLLRKLDMAYGGAVQNLDGSVQQHVFTMNYELSPTRSFGGRIVTQNADTNWYVSFRNSGAKGTETYFIIGDPNARRFVSQALIKIVLAV
jgi:hypothetical protein